METLFPPIDVSTLDTPDDLTKVLVKDKATPLFNKHVPNKRQVQKLAKGWPPRTPDPVPEPGESPDVAEPASGG